VKQSETTRNYNCKDEELPVVCRYALSCIRRDLADFAVFSPVFNEDYLNRFQAKINLVDELVSPKIETDELKKITNRLYLTIVQNNLKVLNELYGQLIDLLNVGKSLYKNTNPLKAKEYVFSALKKMSELIKNYDKTQYVLF
jgi:hypothetical protein